MCEMTASLTKRAMSSFAKQSHPKHIWEVYRSFKCPVIGACLSADEHKKLVRKLGYQVKKLKSHHCHTIIMDRLGGENRISLKIDRYLRHKYRNALSEYFNLSEDQFTEAWRDGLQKGEMDALFYVAAVRDDLSDDTLAEIFGEVHMLGHSNLSEIMRERRDCTLQRETNRKLSRLLNQEKNQAKKLRRENSQLKASLHEARRLYEKSERSRTEQVSEEKTVTDLERETAMLKENISILENQSLAQNEHIRQLEREKRRLQIETFEIQSTHQHLAEEMNHLISQMSNFVQCKDDCGEACPMSTICAKRILIVGGVTKMKHLYKHLIESVGGAFEYHDGYMSSGKQSLESRIRRSDLIICPVNCNSHGAAKSVKKFCQKYKKSVKMLPSSSLSAISNVLFENAAKN